MVYAIEINDKIFPAARITSIGTLLNTLIPVFFIAMTLLFLLYLLWGGLDWIISGSNKENVIKAQSKWRYAILGFTVIMISILLVKVLGYITNIKFPL